VDTVKERWMVGSGDVARWFTFGGFWGFVFYLLSLIGLLAGHRRQPVGVHMPTVLVGMLIHVSGFVGLVSLFSIVQMLVTGKSTTQTAQERIGGGVLEQSVGRLAVSGATGSVVPFGIATGCIRVAEGVTGEAAFVDGGEVSWPRAVLVTMGLSSVTAMAVARITAWVARDARTGAADLAE
jgi:hypothetical protein